MSENADLRVIDTGQIAFLIIKGFQFETECKPGRSGKNKVIFVFKKATQKDLDEYWNSEFFKFKQELDSIRKIIESIKENQD
jgi:hypothetical protein